MWQLRVEIGIWGLLEREKMRGSFQDWEKVEGRRCDCGVITVSVVVGVGDAGASGSGTSFSSSSPHQKDLLWLRFQSWFFHIFRFYLSYSLFLYSNHPTIFFFKIL